jgi:hypothetical protein
MIVGGIDPGLSGAVALLGAKTVSWLTYDMPTLALSRRRQVQARVSTRMR